MNHLRTGICLLIVISDRHTVKLCRRIITGKNTGRILPSNGRTCFHLRPRQFTVYSLAVAPLRHKVINSAFTFGITRIPILNSAILHLSAVMHYNLHNSGMQLVFVTHRRRTPLQIGNIRIIIRHNQSSFELSGVAGINPEISGQLHWTTHSLRNIDERAVGKYRRVQCRKEIITITHYRTQIFLNQIGMLTYSLAEGTEDDSLLHQRLLESGLYGYGVHYGIHCHTTQRHLFFQRDTQLIEGLDQLRIHLIHTLRTVLFLGRVGII